MESVIVTWDSLVRIALKQTSAHQRFLNLSIGTENIRAGLGETLISSTPNVQIANIFNESSFVDGRVDTGI